MQTQADKFKHYLYIFGFGVYVAYVIYLIISYVSGLNGIIESNASNLLGRDFVNFWSSAHIAIEGQAQILYDRIAYRAYLFDTFGAQLNSYSFSYPPHSLFMFAPFGGLQYVYGFILWTFGGLAFAYAATRQWFTEVKLSFWIILGPAAMIAIFGGQTGVWLVAFWMMALALLDRRPIVAGILIGMLTVKPQIGVLLAVYLLCQGHWRAIFSAVATSIIMVVSSLIFFGIEPWAKFISEVLPFQSELISKNIGIFDYMVHTPFKWVINLGLGKHMAWSVQLPFMALGLALIIWSSFKPVDKRLKICLLSILTFLFSPYMAIYDMAILAFAACLFWQYYKEAYMPEMQNHHWVIILVSSLIVTPVVGLYAAILHIPLSVILMCIFIAVMIREVLKTIKDNSFILLK